MDNNKNHMGESGSSSSETEDEDAFELTDQVEKNFFKTLSCLKNKDPKIYDKEARFFGAKPELGEEFVKQNRTKKSEAPLNIRTYERNVLLQSEGNLEADEDDSSAVEKPLTYVQEQNQLKETFKKILDDESDESDEEIGGLLHEQPKQKTQKETDTDINEKNEHDPPSLYEAVHITREVDSPDGNEEHSLAETVFIKTEIIEEEDDNSEDGYNFMYSNGLGEFNELSCSSPEGSVGEKILPEPICGVCNKHFENFENLKIHLKIAHNEIEKHKCHYCEQEFSHEGNLSKHLRVHESRMFMCTVCGKAFTRKKNLKIHSQLHTNSDNFLCEICNKGYSLRNSYNKHMNNHHQTNVCKVCGKLFNSTDYLRIHMKTHMGSKFTCEHCGRSFSSNGNLKKHINTHTGEEKFVCSFCNKTFNKKANWKSHLTIHTGTDRYPCEVCGKSYTRKDSMICHMKSHTDDVKYHCALCDKLFICDKNYKLHMKIHKKNKTFNCEFCDKNFTGEYSNRTHMRTIHNWSGKYTCSLCPNRTYNRKKKLKIHKMKIHSVYECDFCDRKFTSNTDLKTHINDDHPFTNSDYVVN